VWGGQVMSGFRAPLSSSIQSQVTGAAPVGREQRWIEFLLTIDADFFYSWLWEAMTLYGKGSCARTPTIG
jgi:hypothetical protein